MENKTEKKSVFVICSVRKADEATKMGLVAYKQKLESEGHKVHLPHVDTNQFGSGYEICVENTTANIAAKETHIIYDATSQGSHFDIGVVFIDAYLHPEKKVYVQEHMRNDSLCISMANHLPILFDDKLGGYETWVGRFHEMLQAKIIPVSYMPEVQISHIALGMAFALCTLFAEKRIKVMYNGGIMDANGQYFILFERSFGTMIIEWEEAQKKLDE